jgi:signal peptidase I
MDYTAILFELAAVLTVYWIVDRLFLRSGRKRRAIASGGAVRDPWLVAQISSFLPILLIVLGMRSAVAEPYRIPSGSMLPTLEIGDFIVVSKFSYGVRLPGFNVKAVDLGEPARGDVVVFRPPWAPGEAWIKRVVGLPGDRVVVQGEKIWINGEPVVADKRGAYQASRPDEADAYLAKNEAIVLNEHLDAVEHSILQMPTINASPLGAPSVPNADNPDVVPSGCYFVMGDNRDDSEDSRYHGCVPETALVGKALFVWMNLSSPSRIGTRIR